MQTPNNDVDAYMAWLSELDPEDIVAELKLDSDTLLSYLKEYVEEKYGTESEDEVDSE